ncbi:radical SAM protein [Chloroflexota bacterium]
MGAKKMTEDYVFRYKLNLESRTRSGLYQHRLTELFRIILQNLLDIIVPSTSGKDVKIDGFSWLMHRGENYQIFPERGNSPNSSNRVEKSGILDSDSGHDENSVFQNARNAAFYEPRIEFINKLIESLLSVVELEKGGQKVDVDGFQLKNLQDWLVNTGGDPGEIFEYAGSRCNCDCVFCLNKGTPPTLVSTASPKRTAEAEFEEMKTRIKYFSPKAGSTLFHSLGSIYEPMAHPHFMDVLLSLREKTSKPFRITTNGRKLTPGVIAKLAKIKPLYLYLSLNSSSPSRRRNLMSDPEPEIAIGALPLIRKQGIPYAVGIVPWPVETIAEMLEDLSSTVSYAAEHEAHLVEVHLPGHSNFFSSKELFDTGEVWPAIVSRLRELRKKYDCPIVAMPTMYEENIYQSQKNLPEILGVVRNSPAYLSGLKRGDIILRINGLPVRNRPQARDLLSIIQQGEIKKTSLLVGRNSHTAEINLDLTRYSYPYFEEIDNQLGVIFMGTGLRMSYLEGLKEVIQARHAKRVLFLSSALIKPTFEHCLAESQLFGDSQLKIDIEIPKNNFFGGNIFMGDLLVVQDFIDCIQKYIRINKGIRPDLVVIPSSPFNLSEWGRDLTGRVYLDIERETGVPVELLGCATIYD